MKKQNYFLNSSYFDIVAYLGSSTTHLDGIKATKTMIKKADIGKCKKILDVGCGTGYTACYLARKYGCDVIGIDISKSMIEKAKERASKVGLNISFQVADAINLPFEDNAFDALIGESITVYLDKEKALKEYFRVLKSGGCFADMEFTWLKNPTKEIEERTCEVLDINLKILTKSDWENLFKSKKIKDMQISVYTPNTSNFNNLKRLFGHGLSTLPIIYKIFSNPFIKERIKQVSSHFQKYSDYLGYGIYIGRNAK